MTPTAHIGNENPASFGWDEPATYAPFTYHGVDFPGGVHDGTQAWWTKVLDTIVPHIPGGLHPGWCWGGEHRNVTGGTTRSFHAFGTAVDLNAPANPRGGSFGVGPYRLPPTTPALLAPLGVECGGTWTPATPPDPMHLQDSLSPADTAALGGAKPATVAPVAPVSDTQLGTRTLRQGSTGTDVAALQHVLNLWYPHLTPLAVDGIYGPLTAGRVEYLQVRANITVDGICGPQTYGVLHVQVRY